MKTPRIGFRTIGFAATALSAAYTYGFTARHLILAPVREAWWFVPMFDRWSRGDIPYDMIFGQEGEHRHPYVNLICLVLATWTNWDLRAELIINVALLAVISAVCIVSVSRFIERRLCLAHVAAVAAREDQRLSAAKRRHGGRRDRNLVQISDRGRRLGRHRVGFRDAAAIAWRASLGNRRSA